MRKSVYSALQIKSLSFVSQFLIAILLSLPLLTVLLEFLLLPQERDSGRASSPSLLLEASPTFCTSLSGSG